MNTPVRRDIEDLTPAELASYEHAVKCLHDSGEYGRLARIHNVVSENPPSGGEHHSELFLPWHRSLLHQFEQALRIADPRRPAPDLTIPYWDWSRFPRGGKRYPDPFLREDSPLFDELRKQEPPARGTTPDEITTLVTLYPSWEDFAGPPKGSSGLPHGVIEAPRHDAMHADFVRGTMKFPSTAANDPLFWSFHSFLDKQFARWQRIHGTAPQCLDCELRGFPGTTVGDVVDVEALGYGYEFTPEELELRADLSRARREMLDLTRSAGPIGLDHGVARSTWWGGEPGGGELLRARLIAELETPESVLIHAYLHPASIGDDRRLSPEFSVGQFAVWIDPAHHGHGHDGGAVVTSLPMTVAAQRLLQGRDGQEWCVSLRASFPLASDEHGTAVRRSATHATVSIRALQIELLMGEPR